MQLEIHVDDYAMELEVPEDYMEESREAFDRLDEDMDEGIQLGREWYERPDRRSRAQFAADRLLTAIETDNHALALLAAGYILTRMEGVRGVKLDNNGEPSETTFF